MDYGITLLNGYPISPAKLGIAVEDRGFESLFFPEHTHIPLDTHRSDGRPALGYARTYDPFVALAAAAVVTERIKLGTGVCLVAQRDPFTTAKEVASLDLLSGGRVLFGVGAGWNREEMANHGTDPRTRMALMADRVRAMKEIWNRDEADYHGEFIDFDPVWSWPKPVQRPVPVLVGGNGPGTEDRVLAIGDGWLPQCGPLRTVDELATRISSLRERAADAGRGHIPVTLFGTPYDRALIDQLAETGADRCLFSVQTETEPEMFKLLDELAALVA